MVVANQETWRLILREVERFGRSRQARPNEAFRPLAILTRPNNLRATLRIFAGVAHCAARGGSIKLLLVWILSLYWCRSNHRSSGNG